MLALPPLATPLRPPAFAAPAPCRVVASRTSLPELGGRRIASLAIVREGPDPMPGALDRLHVRTQEATLRRLVPLVAGDTIDTLRVAETFRRLRRQPWLGDAVLEATTCSDTGAVALVLTTRDAFSTRPTMSIGSRGGSRVGVAERNVLGTGREAGAYLRAEPGRTGVGVAVVDPWFLGAPLRASLARDAFGDGATWAASLGSHRLDPREQAWRGELTLVAGSRLPPGGRGTEIDAFAGQALASRRIALDAGGAWRLLAGVEADRTRLVAEHGALLVGPRRVVRDFAGVDAGLARTATAYDTLTWLLPSRAIVDVPVATEGELVVGAGRDRGLAAPALHVDGWLGRAWLPARATLVVADVWANGFAVRGGMVAGTLRGTLRTWLAAPGGHWLLRLGAERLLAPDPTVRTLALDDATALVLPDAQRLSAMALAAHGERALLLTTAARGWGLQLAAFGAASLRWRPASRTALPEAEQLATAVVGAGVGIVGNRAGRGGVRLDVVMPVSTPAGIAPRPALRLTIVPWFADGRARRGVAAIVR